MAPARDHAVSGRDGGVSVAAPNVFTPRGGSRWILTRWRRARCRNPGIRRRGGGWLIRSRDLGQVEVAVVTIIFNGLQKGGGYRFDTFVFFFIYVHPRLTPQHMDRY